MRRFLRKWSPPNSVQSGKVPVVHAGMQQTVSELQPKISTYSVATTRSIMQPLPLVEQPSESKRSLGEWLSIWWEGIRPAYLALSLLPVVLGSVAAWTQSISPKTPRGNFHPIRFAITLVAVLLLQIGAHLINDYYDYLRGIDTNNSLGPGGLIQQGLIKPVRVLVVWADSIGAGYPAWGFRCSFGRLACHCVWLDRGTRRIFLQWDT